MQFNEIESGRLGSRRGSSELRHHLGDTRPIQASGNGQTGKGDIGWRNGLPAAILFPNGAPVIGLPGPKRAGFAAGMSQLHTYPSVLGMHKPGYRTPSGDLPIIP